MKKRYYELMGVRVNLLNIVELNSLIAQAVEKNVQWIIANHNLNSLYLFHHSSKMRAFYNLADYVHIDGMPLVIMGKLLNLPFERKHRVTYADWVWFLMQEAAERGWRIFYLGSKPGVANKGAKILHQKFPNLNIATAHGYFDPTPESQDNQELIDRINAYQPHVLMVGMGMPRQEMWIADNFDKIKVNAILPSGACIDYVAGEVATPPRWMGKVGLEWLYRLITEPRRLWKRYLWEPWFLLILLLKEIWSKSILARQS